MNESIKDTTLQKKDDSGQAAANVVGSKGKVLSDNRPLIQKKANNTGLPDNLKSGIENLSGHAMDDVKVHYNSDKPAQLNAHAYAQGSEIHLASGQEKHLPHEAWHVVQQKQGRVKPTMQMKGKVNVNDDQSLEKEADVMGTKALQLKSWFSSGLKTGGVSQTVQRFKTLATDDYNANAGDHDSHLFTKQTVLPVAVHNQHLSIAHQITRTNVKQPLNVSDDGTMAINNTTEEAKEFYANNTVFTNANTKLNATESSIRLVKSGSMTLAASGKTLSKITPEASVRLDDNAHEFAALVSHICIEMASGVMGNETQYQHAAVLQAPGEENMRFINMKSGLDEGDTSVGRLASGLALGSKDVTNEQLRNTMLNPNAGTPLPGKQYGIASGNGQLNKKAKRAGVNQYAKPEVGEGYATFTLPGHADQNMDYTGGAYGIQRLTDIWGYHFAGVVAKSLDGNDTITLENYNRTDDVFRAVSAILTQKIQDNQAELGAVRAQELSPELGDHRAVLQQKMTDLLEAIGRNSEEAQQEYMNILRSYTSNRSWFFKMQGSHLGQSFHEQQAASGAFLNPLTLRVRKQEPRTEALRQAAITNMMQFTAPPAAIAGEAEFANLAATRNRLLTLIGNAETSNQVINAYTASLTELAAFMVQAQLGYAIRMTTTEGAVLPGRRAAYVLAGRNTQAKVQRGQNVLTQCRNGLQTLLDACWFYQTTRKAELRQRIATINTIYICLDQVLTYTNNNRNLH